MKQSVLQVVIPLIVVLLILPGDLMARRTTQLTVEKTDQEIIEGLLLDVDMKQESLVIDVANIGIKIYMDEIDTIQVEQKIRGRYIGKGFLIGAGVGAGLGLIFGISAGGEAEESLVHPVFVVLGSTFFFGLLGLVGGTLAALDAPKKGYKKIRVKGKSPDEIKKILKKLKKKALFR